MSMTLIIRHSVIKIFLRVNSQSMKGAIRTNKLNMKNNLMNPINLTLQVNFTKNEPQEATIIRKIPVIFNKSKQLNNNRKTKIKRSYK